MGPTATLALATALLLAATGTQAADMPKRKPGLWQIETTMAAAPGMGPIKQCIDERTDNFYQQFGEQHKDKCTESEIRNAGDKIVVHSVCRMGGSTSTTDATFSGRFDSDYRGDIRIKYKWTCYCPPGDGQ